MKRFIAVQIGARRSYAVPSILERAGMLEVFYTDLCANIGLGAVMTQLCPSFLQQGAVKNLLGRQIPPNLKDKTHTFTMPILRYLIRKQLTSKRSAANLQAFVQFGTDLAEAMIGKGLGEGSHLYNMFGECPGFLKFAKQQGLTTVTEVFIPWSAHKIVEAERERFPHLELPIAQTFNQQEFQQATNSGNRWLKEVIECTDWAIAPSEAVRRDMDANFGFPASRCFVVPYAINETWLQHKNQPIRGRVLFIGTADLRKGIHILAMAAQNLNHRSYEYRIAGNVTEQIRQHPLTQKLCFLGRIPRTDVYKEYALADVFVLPSLAEGSAEVTYEALASGIPVITTAAAGSVVRDGIDGFIVPERNPLALAQRIEELIENRELRNRMAVAAKERAKEYTWDRYGERLLTALQATSKQCSVFEKC